MKNLKLFNWQKSKKKTSFADDAINKFMNVVSYWFGNIHNVNYSDACQILFWQITDYVTFTFLHFSVPFINCLQVIKND